MSAHFPPNFVSGGTLAPQRQARGLRAAGHDVSVYAGWLDVARRPLETFDTVDEAGVPVRWVVSTPWTAWDDRRNFDNPPVAADFARHLAAVKPDVVHLHSLQSLGSGLVEEATRCGARVVVTMHDFWWWCGRQFLVDRHHRPCSLVVACGGCECEVDRPWLDERNALLRRRLASADVVLAPSPSAAAVFVANGVPAASVRVDENAVPDAAPRARPPRAPDDGPVRFVYTGGPNPMKGVHVLLDAVRRMAAVPGWALTAYGVAPFLRDEGVDVGGLPVEVRPPFDHDDLDDVLAAADVLVVPSVMRESYSIVTREALLRGVPVVCSDSIGPEEVVEPGRNGLVVPTADAAALAAAMTRLASEPGLLDRLADGCGDIAVRSVADQVAGLERLYEELVAADADGSGAHLSGLATREVRQDGAGGPGFPGDAPDDGARHGAPARRRPVRRVLFLVGIEGAPLRYRARLPAEGLALHGVSAEVRHYRDPELPALAESADAVVSYRVPATTQVLDLLTACRRRGTPVLCDLDDLIFDPDLAAEIPALAILPPDEAELWLEGVRRYRTTLEACDAFVGSTAELCRHAEEVTGLPAERFANGVGILLARAADAALARPRSAGPLRIGYLSGTNTHDHDWAAIEPVVADVLGAHRDVELWLGGFVSPSVALDRYAARVRRLPMLPWLELPAVLRDLDVNLAPLVLASRFNEAKSAIKWLEAALTATPTVASATGPFREAILSGVNGLLADGPGEWRTALDRLLGDGLLRASLGGRARRDALLQWSPYVQGARYLEILETAPSRRRSAGQPWSPVVHDEPYVPVALEPYELPAPTPAPSPSEPQLRRRARQVRALAGAGYRSVRHDGFSATARRTVAFGRRHWPRARAELARVAASARSAVRR